MNKSKQGDRVTRTVFMDDGTWQKHGDKCLKNSPLKHGYVESRSGRVVKVIFDDGSKGNFLDIGLDYELHLCTK